MKKKIFIFTLALIMSCLIMSNMSNQQAKAAKYIVRASALNIRQARSINSKIIGRYAKNHVVNVISKNASWALTSRGYVKLKYLSKVGKRNSYIGGCSRGGMYTRPFFSILHKSNLSVADIHNLLKGTKLKGVDQAVYDIQNQYGINAYATIAIMKFESGYGNNRLARELNNPFSIKRGSRRYRYFNSKSDAVYAFGELLSGIYVSEGYIMIDKIENKYCPPGGWASNVKYIMVKDRQKTKIKNRGSL